MEFTKMPKQMIDFNKATFDNTYSAMIFVQGQIEKMVGTFGGKANWLSDDWKKLFNEWTANYKKSQEDFKKSVDENYQKFSDYFGKSE